MRKTTDSEYWVNHTNYEILKQYLLGFFFFCGSSTRIQVMASRYVASRPDPLDTPKSVGLL